MKKRFLLFVVSLSLVLAGFSLSGCDALKEVKRVDPSPYIEHFDRFSALYGTERMELLTKLGYELSDTKFEHGFTFELPLQAKVHDVSFDISVHLDSDAKLQSVSYRTTYSYPEDKDLALQQIMATCKYLADNLGQPAEVDMWNDWYEEESGEELDQTTPIYCSEEQLIELFENEFGGGIMRWDTIESNAFKAYMEYREPRGWVTYGQSLGVNVDCVDGIITFSIGY